MTVMGGLRERKKAQTARRIVEAAFAAFTRRGFEEVTVAEIARAADVSPATVFNYFATKEDIVFAGMVSYEAHLIEAISSRPPGASVIDAFRAVVSEPGGLLGDDDPGAPEKLAAAARLMAGSRALQVRELALFDEHTTALADALAAEPGTADRAWLLAHALVGVSRQMTATVRRMAMAGAPVARIAETAIAEASRSLDLLEGGFAGASESGQARGVR